MTIEFWHKVWSRCFSYFFEDLWKAMIRICWFLAFLKTFHGVAIFNPFYRYVTRVYIKACIELSIQKIVIFIGWAKPGVLGYAWTSLKMRSFNVFWVLSLVFGGFWTFLWCPVREVDIDRYLRKKKQLNLSFWLGIMGLAQECLNLLISIRENQCSWNI